jgi:hypothetical protein
MIARASISLWPQLGLFIKNGVIMLVAVLCPKHMQAFNQKMGCLCMVNPNKIVNVMEF